jgi:putative peptidoglycan lipid II flippase
VRADTGVSGPARGHGTSLFRAVATVGGLTLVSRVTGFLRDILIAAQLGAGPLADAFFVAFKLPNFLRRLFAEGAFNAAYVPLFAGTLEAEGREAARAFAEKAQAVMLAVLLPLVVLAIVFMPHVVRVFAPGFELGGLRYEATVELARVTFPYLLLIALAALHGGILNSLGRFGAPAAAPILLNLVLIAALLAPPFLDSRAHLMAWGVFLAGVLQLAWLAASVRRAGMLPSPVRPSLAPEVRLLFRRMAPGAIGAGVAQINLLVDLIFASLLPTGAVSYLYYGDRVSQLPLGVIGVAIGTALLPMLSRQLRAGALAAAMQTQNRAVEMCLLLTLPAAVALVVLAFPIVQVLFERGAFGPAETAATAGALAAYAVGLPGYVLVKVLAPCFHARGDTVTPVKIAVTSLVANVVLIVLLIGPLAHVGIALATALSNGLNAGLLAVGLARRELFRPDDRLRRRLPRIGAATLVLALVLWLLQAPLATLPAILALAVLVATGGLVYLAAAHLSGATDLRELRGMLRRR